MHLNAIVKARSRLRIAERALSAASNAKTYEAFTDAWYTFLVAAKNVYTMLDKGAKASAQSRQWFGAIKQHRKNDPLLQYVFQARDDDEHGLQPVAHFVPERVALGVKRPGLSGRLSGEFYVDGNLNVHILKLNEPMGLGIEKRPSKATLIPVTGRGGVVYDVPHMHEGKPIGNQTPYGIGQLTLAYLTALVDEAQTRA